jgi:hypothetical protein
MRKMRASMTENKNIGLHIGLFILKIEFGEK